MPEESSSRLLAVLKVVFLLLSAFMLKTSVDAKKFPVAATPEDEAGK
jgi:hypothetical protein